MQYKSTRDSSLRLNAAEVITAGISGDGGLFVPETLPGGFLQLRGGCEGAAGAAGCFCHSRWNDYGGYGSLRKSPKRILRLAGKEWRGISDGTAGNGRRNFTGTSQKD